MTIEQRPSLSIALPKSYLFTSESVTEGHPDKMCDQISDAILDAIISKEIELEREGYIAPSGQPADVSRMRCACETLATTGLVAVAGEIRTQAYVDVAAIVREVAEVFDLRPGAIIDALDLRRPIYRKTAAYGHFGRELPEFTWERTDRAEDLRKTCRLA